MLLAKERFLPSYDPGEPERRRRCQQQPGRDWLRGSSERVVWPEMLMPCSRRQARRTIETYGPAEIEAQKKGTYDAGYDGWVLWSPGSKYEPFVPALEKTLVSRKKP